MKKGWRLYLRACLIGILGVLAALSSGVVGAQEKVEAADIIYMIKVAPAPGTICSNQSHIGCIGLQNGDACTENGESGTCVMGEATRDCLCIG